MDKPSRDMRDPAYRRQLEREQALDTSAPELMFVGPAKAAQAGLAVKTFGRSATPAKSITENVQIGKYVNRNEKITNAIKEHMLNKAAPEERAAVAKKIEENLIKAGKQNERARTVNDFQNAVIAAETGAMRSLGAQAADEMARRFKERNLEQSSDKYKKGGKVKMLKSKITTATKSKKTPSW